MTTRDIFAVLTVEMIIIVVIIVIFAVIMYFKELKKIIKKK